MAQSITLKVAGKQFALKVTDETQEHYMRLAAEDINSKLEAYNKRYPTTPLEDKLVFVTLNEFVQRLRTRDIAEKLKSEADSISADVSAYLEGIEEK